MGDKEPGLINVHRSNELELSFFFFVYVTVVLIRESSIVNLGLYFRNYRSQLVQGDLGSIKSPCQPALYYPVQPLSNARELWE